MWRLVRRTVLRRVQLYGSWALAGWTAQVPYMCWSKRMDLRSAHFVPA
jgi:hypothetical protein